MTTKPKRTTGKRSSASPIAAVTTDEVSATTGAPASVPKDSKPAREQVAGDPPAAPKESKKQGGGNPAKEAAREKKESAAPAQAGSPDPVAPPGPKPAQPVAPAQPAPAAPGMVQVPQAVLNQLALQAQQASGAILKIVNLSRKREPEKLADQGARRRKLIAKIEAARKSKVVCYLTTLRGNVSGLMADDAVRVFFDQFLEFERKPIERLDIFLCSNGGVTTVPWRLVSLAREYCTQFSVIVPYRAYSAATMLAIGADEIVMHPFAELGPIDPTVSNDYNPHEENTGRRLGISVEDVKAYITFVKTTVGITHEDELIRALEILAQKVHPLALGNVERFLQQSRMMGRKIMRTHMDDSDSHIINEIIENLASKLYFHGHPINRREAKEELKLKVVTNLSQSLESAIWDLYLLYEDELQNRDAFNPAGDMARIKGAIPPTQPGGFGLEYHLLHAIVESRTLAARFSTHRRFCEVMAPPHPLPQLKEDVLSQGWNYEKAPRAGGK
jgi:hypothetical protein